MRRASRLWFAFAIGAWLIPCGSVAAKDAPQIEIVAIEPGRNDTLLVCTMRTRGLPDAATRETLASGLPSALIISLSLFDASGNRQGEALSEVRIEPDLWTQTFLMRTPLAELRVRTLDEIATFLSDLGPLPVSRAESIRARHGLRIRARLAVHPLAPAEADRVRAILTGDSDAGGSNRKEVSVSIGHLLRYFLKHGNDEEWACEAASGSFAFDALPVGP